MLLAAVADFAASGSAFAAKFGDSRVVAALERGSQYLKRRAPGRTAVARGWALGLLKSGTSPDDPAISEIIENKLLHKFQVDGSYKPASPVDLYYEAGVDLMVYADSHPEKYEKEMQTLVNILLESQHAEGFWTYPPNLRQGDRGDTSITQYALLGLWEAERHGFSIPNAVFDKAASWLIATWIYGGLVF